MVYKDKKWSMNIMVTTMFNNIQSPCKYFASVVTEFSTNNNNDNTKQSKPVPTRRVYTEFIRTNK